MYLSFGMVRAGSVPLGMELSSLGPFLNNQLCAGYALNVIFLAVEMYRLLMERTVLHPGCVISPAVIYLDFFLHRHPGPDGYPGQRLEGTGQRDGTHFARGSVGNCISVYTVPPFSFSRIR